MVRIHQCGSHGLIAQTVCSGLHLFVVEIEVETIVFRELALTSGRTSSYPIRTWIIILVSLRYRTSGKSLSGVACLWWLSEGPLPLGSEGLVRL